MLLVMENLTEHKSKQKSRYIISPYIGNKVEQELLLKLTYFLTEICHCRVLALQPVIVSSVLYSNHCMLTLFRLKGFGSKG